MSNYRIAVRYAKSLLQLSVEQKKLEPVLKDMEMLQRLISNSRELQNFLKNPIIHSYKKSAILKKIFEKKIDKLTFLFIELITKKTREDVLKDIVDQFIVEYRKYKKIEIVGVFTTISIDESLKAEFTELAKKYIEKDHTIELQDSIDEDLIGGFVLRIGDKQIDDSVSSKLREVRKKLIVS